MIDAEKRAKKFELKIDENIIKSRFENQASSMVSQYNQVCANQKILEMQVKQILEKFGTPSIKFPIYIAYAKRLAKILITYSNSKSINSTFYNECDALTEEYFNSGLSPFRLTDIGLLFGYSPMLSNIFNLTENVINGNFIKFYQLNNSKFNEMFNPNINENGLNPVNNSSKVRLYFLITENTAIFGTAFQLRKSFHDTDLYFYVPPNKTGFSITEKQITYLTSDTINFQVFPSPTINFKWLSMMELL